MVVPTVRRKLTYEDYVRFPSDGFRHEILDGAHVVSPAPGLRHQFVSFALGGLFFHFLRQNPVGRAACAPTQVLLAPHDVVEPDFWYVSDSKSALLNDKNVQGAPELVVEILSPSSRRVDQGKKRSRYEKLGVGEYWVLDPERDRATVLRRAHPGAARFEPPVVLTAEAAESLSTPLLPGLAIPLRELFAR